MIGGSLEEVGYKQYGLGRIYECNQKIEQYKFHNGSNQNIIVRYVMNKSNSHKMHKKLSHKRINQTNKSMSNNNNQANPPKWQTIMRLDCQTQKTIDITSYGDWGFSLKRIPINALAQSLQDIAIKDRLENRYCYFGNHDEEQEQPDIKVDEYPEEDNIESALSSYISVEINETQQWFRDKYGFWDIQDFKVYDKDGNGSICSFQTKDHAYIGYYGTS